MYQRDQLFGIYNLECDITGAVNGDDDSGASLDLVKTVDRPDGLLIVSCNVGAHSQQVAIIDLGLRSARPAFSVTGSYSARWEVQEGELWIGYDEPCDTGPSVECPDGFVTTFVQYPPDQSASGN